VSDGQLEWPVPVVTKADSTRRLLRLTIEDGEVVGRLQGQDFIIPPGSDDAWCDAIKRARQVASQMGRGLS
jgi:hypothetical protein